MKYKVLGMLFLFSIVFTACKANVDSKKKDNTTSNNDGFVVNTFEPDKPASVEEKVLSLFDNEEYEYDEKLNCKPMSFHKFLSEPDKLSHMNFYEYCGSNKDSYYANFDNKSFPLSELINITEAEKTDNVSIENFDTNIYGVRAANNEDEAICITFINDYIVVNQGKEIYKAKFNIENMCKYFENMNSGELEEFQEIDFPNSWFLANLDENNWNKKFLNKVDLSKNSNITVDTTLENSKNMLNVSIQNSSDVQQNIEIYCLAVNIDNEYYEIPVYTLYDFVSHANVSDSLITSDDGVVTKEKSVEEYMPLKKGSYALEIGDTYGEFTVE